MMKTQVYLTWCKWGKTMDDLYKWFIKRNCEQDELGQPTVDNASAYIITKPRGGILDGETLVKVQVTLTTDNHVRLHSDRLKYTFRGTGSKRDGDSVVVQGSKITVKLTVNK